MSKAIVPALLVAFSLARPPAFHHARDQTDAAAATHALVGARVVAIGGAPAIDNATILTRSGKMEAIGP